MYCKRMSLNSNLITIAFGSLLSSEVVFKEIQSYLKYMKPVFQRNGKSESSNLKPPNYR